MTKMLVVAPIDEVLELTRSEKKAEKTHLKVRAEFEGSLRHIIMSIEERDSDENT